MAERNGKFKVNDQEQTNVENVYAIGDVIYGKLELTPTAIMTGKRLADRLFNNGTKLMDYDNVPTTVFTPQEYGTVGLTDEEAESRYGEENVEVFHTEFSPLEYQYNKSFTVKRPCYVKVVCVIPENMRIVGFHILCPNAGEITQGVAIAVKAGVTKDQLDDVVGIHPTIAETFTDLTITKRDNPNPVKSSC